MGNKVLSIEIGSQVTKLCVASFQHKNPKIYKTLVLTTPYDCVEDGYIKDVNTLANTINKKLREEKINVGQVVFTIASSKIANREVILPMVKENKIKDIIIANAEDYFPIDVKDYNITYFIMEKIMTKEVKNYRLLVMAVHNNLLNTYYALAESLKLKVLSIDYVGNSVYQIYQKQAAQEISMVVQINEQNTLVNVLNKNVLELQRIIPYGYDTVINALLENTSDKLNKPEDAFNILRDKPLIGTNYSSGYQSYGEEVQVEHTARLVKEITDSLRYLTNNVSRVIDYYASKKQEAKIQTIYLTGMGAKFRGIEQLFSNELGISTKVISNLLGVSFTNQILVENYSMSDFAACAGATIAPVGMQPAKYTIRETYKNNIVAVATISSLALLTSIVLWFVSDQAVRSASSEKTRLSKEISQLESIDVVYSDNLKIKEELTTIKSLEDLCYNSNENLVPLIQELEKKLPSEVTVHSITSSNTGILMNLTATSKEAAAFALIQLKSIEYLSGVTTAGISETTDEVGISQVSFSITANIVEPLQNQEGAQ